MALDFGCGVGRLTRAFGHYFEQVIGVDISECMIARAKKLNASFPNCEFVVNQHEDLRVFPNDHFDMVFSGFVLQHIPSNRLIRLLICEFVRVLKDGGLLVFQLPSHLPLRNRIQPRRRLHALMRSELINGLSNEGLGLHPLCASFVIEREVVNLVQAVRGNILEVKVNPNYGSAVESRTYFITK
jgi:ubiquinone/menaquinone biosynthesis C-methylase UbiE